MTRLLAIVATIAFAFLLAVYMLIMAPAMGSLDAALYGPDSPEVDSPITDNAGMISTIVLRVIPAMLAIGTILFGFAAVSHQQTRRGRI